ncbi:MAG: Glucosyltransferase-like protein [Chaenotheca gracillima]|nr:MAG: Glucosyltransferase-like protein [Chaenotheca gracillima]
MSSAGSSIAPTPSATRGNLASDLKPAGEASASVKPCCVCKDEKAQRDECMLFSDGDAQENCRSTIDKYKSCMAGYGFKLP